MKEYRKDFICNKAPSLSARSVRSGCLFVIRSQVLCTRLVSARNNLILIYLYLYTTSSGFYSLVCKNTSRKPTWYCFSHVWKLWKIYFFSTWKSFYIFRVSFFGQCNWKIHEAQTSQNFCGSRKSSHLVSTYF